ncbi:TonB-dependent receptor domain-containing protein [Winogradskyella flava]|uniref:TonB-dependent receptor n=1 Tax=Winogradskyella flava TaxID=1884876 RepID=A0A842IR27_9FLAO|nr:outer membrane beta-barrel family protein [Winogradskyella flava]MBC2843917.1 TonB-dependent receptor [Winogradskyella flava]
MIARLRFFFSTIFIVLSLNAFAQDFSISGKVVDANGSPIEFANIILSAENEESFFKGTSTDDEGFFKIDNLVDTTYFVRISFIGFEDFEQKIILKGNLNLKIIQLDETSENLDEVTVIGKKPTITRKPDRLIFNVENTALIEGSTLGVLKSTPGVIVSESGINIKSAPAVVYINNRKVQLTTDELIQLLENSPANSIKSIEVITNPPASYDADSGSVVNIIMSKNLITGYRGNISTNYTQGVFPRYNAATSHFFKNNKINLNVNYSYTNQKLNRDEDDRVNFLDDLNAVDQIWKSQTNRNTWSETHNLNLNFDYNIDDRNTLSLTSTALYMPYFKYQIKNRTNIFDENGDFESSFTADNLSRDNKYNIGTDLIFRHDFDNNANLTFNGHFTLYDYERDQKVFQDELNDDDSEFNTLANQDTQIITGKVDYNLPIDDSSIFDAGLKYSNVNTDSDITRTDIVNGAEVLNTDNTDAFKYDEKVFAAYANYSKTWDKWDLNLGLRTEQTNIKGESLILNETNAQDYLNLFPTVSIAHQISDNVSFNGNYKRSIRRPSYTNLNPFTLFLNENTVVLGNPNLVPTYVDYYKLGVDFLKYFSFEAYYMNYDGDIVELPRQDNETNIVAWTPTNLDKKVDYGFDFLVNYYPSTKFGLYAAISVFNVTEEANFGEGFVELSQWSQLFILSPNMSLLKDNSLNINASFWWMNKNLQNLQTVQNLLISSVSVSKSILNKKGVISLIVEDLFNKQDFDKSVMYLNQSSRNFTDSDNRFIKLGFRYNFGNTNLNTNERTTSAEERERLKDLN